MRRLIEKRLSDNRASITSMLCIFAHSSRILSIIFKQNTVLVSLHPIYIEFVRSTNVTWINYPSTLDWVRF